ncbi:HlyD family type I secretion periplasmic adaptor subunit [Roseateles chitinivorans]|uniref:HlyD family type I secretion periplasmic adaptor subunit n=1 Tax=Roseateles chitinivorans TaxID=2917965 RepID=UPI003D66A86F
MKAREKAAGTAGTTARMIARWTCAARERLRRWKSGLSHRFGGPAELWHRQREVFAAAWAARRELAGPARLAEEAAFLPAALAIRDTPMHPAPRRTVVVLIALAAIALVWSLVGRVDIVAVASGKLVVSERSKLVQPLERAVVHRVRVRDGERVRAGETLVELDPTAPAADRESLDEQRLAVSAERWRADRLLETLTALAARDGGAVIAAAVPRAPMAASADLPPDWPAARRDETLAMVRAEWTDLRARLERLDAEADRRRAERDTALAAAARLDAALPLAARREEDLRALAGEGFASTHAWEDRRRERVDLGGELGTLQARARETEAALNETRATRAALIAEVRQRWHASREQAASRLSQIEAEHRKAGRREALTRLVAPVDGTVQQLAVHTTGGIVTEAQTLMVVVPDDAPVTAEVMLENKDIGFVRVGDAAAIKLEAFPFTRHGTLPATVTRVSPDAIDHEQLGPRFAVTLTLAARDIEVDGARVPLRPGMALSAEVRTGSRRVIGFLLSPLERAGSESLKER